MEAIANSLAGQHLAALVNSVNQHIPRDDSDDSAIADNILFSSTILAEILRDDDGYAVMLWRASAKTPTADNLTDIATVLASTEGLDRKTLERSIALIGMNAISHQGYFDNKLWTSTLTLMASYGATVPDVAHLLSGNQGHPTAPVLGDIARRGAEALERLPETN